MTAVSTLLRLKGGIIKTMPPIEMSDVEALLSVDAGKVPPGAVAFFPRDPEAAKRRLATVMAVLTFAGAVALAISGGSHIGTVLVALIAVSLSVGAIPTRPDVEVPPTKRPTLLLTPSGLIIRDDQGLRQWFFEDLADVRPHLHLRSIGLLVVRKDGTRDFIDTTLFDRGEKVQELIGRRLKPREA